MRSAVIHHLQKGFITLILFYNLFVMYPGIPSLASFSPKKAKPVHFTESRENTTADHILVPAANISYFPTEYLIRVAVPGLKREDFCVVLNEGVISIAAQKKEETTCCIHDRREFSYDYWTRAFILPDDADALMTQALYTQGELCIHIPRDKTADNKAPLTVIIY
jgi:HSP20 family protein